MQTATGNSINSLVIMMIMMHTIITYGLSPTGIRPRGKYLDCIINDVIMSAMASQITNLTIVYSTVYSRRRSKKTSKLRVTGPCEGNSPVTGEFPAPRASNAENVSIWWRHHGWTYPNWHKTAKEEASWLYHRKLSYQLPSVHSSRHFIHWQHARHVLDISKSIY